MFGWDVQNSKSDRIKLFLFILVIFLIVSFIFSIYIRTLNSGKTTDVQQESKTISSKSDTTIQPITNQNIKKKGPNEYDQTTKFSTRDLNRSKEVAVQFAKAYHTYNVDKPMEYLNNAQAFMTDVLYKKMKTRGRREVLERSFLSVENTEVTPAVNKSSLVIRWNVIVKGEATSINKKVSKTEDWYLVSLRKISGEWKVEDVRINVPN